MQHMPSRNIISSRHWRLLGVRLLAGLTTIRRIGIVPRLSASFIAVAVLAIAANFLAGHSYIMQITRIEQAAPAAPPQPPPQQLPIPQVTAPISIEAALDYSRALQRFSVAVWQRSAADAAADAEFGTAIAALTQAASHLSNTVVKADNKLAREVLSRTKEEAESARALIQLADERHRVLNEYREHLDQLGQNMKSALDGSFKMFGRFIARQYLLQLDLNLQKVRARLEDAIATDAAPASLLTLAASEHEFSATLDANRSSLERVQGREWLRLSSNEFAALVAHRESLQQSYDVYGERRIKLTQLMTEGAVLAEESLASLQTARQGAAPKVRDATAPPTAAASPLPFSLSLSLSAPAPETTTVTRSDAGPYALIARISIAVISLVFIISLLTVLSIVRPVRRLVDAAAKLAAGDTHIRVARGGMRELDQLAGSFNQMARHLELAGEASRSYQAHLQADVAARTEELRQLAERDPLTQLPNRRYGLLLMEQALAEARSRASYVGVCFLDLDNFKSINDSLGHVFGDQVLAKVAVRLLEVSSSFGHAVRLGGDEFLVIYTDARSSEDIYLAGSRLVQAFHSSIQIEQRELMASISCGVSVFPLHGGTCAELLSSADAALFRAKAMGRNQASLYTADLLQSVSENFSIDQRLRRAIERDEFELVFQPEVCVGSLRVSMVEALLRWRQPDGRLASPAEFLAVGEASGFIAEIDDWVLNAALRAASAWRRGAWPEARVAINVSSRQLLDVSFALRLKDILAQHHLPTDSIEIELTETVLQTGPATIRTLHALKAEGFAIALDDFGTGYSSLTSLAQLPLSRVKLDRSLIEGHGSDGRRAAIARTTIMLCEQLQLQVTAEGIENSEQLGWLLDHDSIYVQGYLISPPLRFGAVEGALDIIHQQMALHVLNVQAPAPGETTPRDLIPFIGSSTAM